MENINYRVEGSKLIIEIDTLYKGIPSNSGKTTIIASTRGNVPITINGTKFYLGVNFYKYQA